MPKYKVKIYKEENGEFETKSVIRFESKYRMANELWEGIGKLIYSIREKHELVDEKIKQNIQNDLTDEEEAEFDKDQDLPTK